MLIVVTGSWKPDNERHVGGADPKGKWSRGADAEDEGDEFDDEEVDEEGDFEDE